MFKIDGDSSGADRLFHTLDRLDKTMSGLNVKTHDVDKATRAAGDGHKKHAQEAAGLDGVLKGLTHRFAKIIELVAEWDAAGFLLELPKRIFDIGEEALRTAAKAERMHSTFGFLFGSEGGDEQFEASDRIAQYSEFSTHRMQELTANLGNAGFKGDDLDAARAAANDIAALNPNKEAGLGAAESALERIRETGKINRRAFVGMHLDADEFYKDLSKSTGKGLKQVEKDVESGSIKIDTVLSTLYGEVAKKTGESELGSAAEKMSHGLDATLTHLGELPDRYFERLRTSQGFAKFSDALSHVLDDLDPDSSTGKRIFGALEGAFNSVADVIGTVDIGELVTDFSNGFSEIAADVKPAVEVLGELWDVVHRIGHAMQEMGSDINDYIIKPISALDDLIKGTAVSKSTRKALNIGDDKGGGNWLHDYTPFGFWADHSTYAGKATGAGFQEGLMSTKPKTAAAAADVGYTSADALESSLDIHSPSRVFRRLGELSGAGFSEGLSGSRRDVADAASAMVSLPPSLGASARGPIQVSVTIPVAIGAHGGDTASQAEEFRMRLRAMLPTELTSAFEQLGMEGGG